MLMLCLLHFLEITLLYEVPVFTHLNVSFVRQVAFLFCMKCVEGFGPKISEVPDSLVFRNCVLG